MKVPKKPSGRRALPFYWWRRFKTHKCLPNKASLLDKIRNGDFEYSEFFKQAKWELHWMKEDQDKFKAEYQGREPEKDGLYRDIENMARKRHNKLMEDGCSDEFEKLKNLTKALSKHFDLHPDTIKDIMSDFNGSTEKLFFHIAELQGQNKDTIEFMN